MVPQGKNRFPMKIVCHLRRLVRTHENSSVFLVILTHTIIVVLDLIDRATFQSVEVPTLLGVWSESPIWIAMGLINIIWLIVWSTPPKVIWGLWASTAVLTGWGIVNMAVGLNTSHPVSLLGPSLILGVAAPLAWTTADTLQEKMQKNEHDDSVQGSRERLGS